MNTYRMSTSGPRRLKSEIWQSNWKIIRQIISRAVKMGPTYLTRWAEPFLGQVGFNKSRPDLFSGRAGQTQKHKKSGAFGLPRPPKWFCTNMAGLGSIFRLDRFLGRAGLDIFWPKARWARVGLARLKILIALIISSVILIPIEMVMSVSDNKIKLSPTNGNGDKSFRGEIS